MHRVLSVVLVLAAGCKSNDGGEASGTIEPSTGPTRGSAGGFSAGLASELAGSAKPATGSAAPAGSGSAGTGAAAVASGSGAAGSGAVGSGAGSAGSAAKPVVTPPVVAAGSGAGSAAKPVVTPPVVAAGSGAGAAAKPVATPPVVAAGSGAGSAAKPVVTPPVVAAGSGAGSAAKPAVTPPVVVAPKPPVAMSPELAAIKLSLQPNWDRDVEGPATISLVVRVSGKDPVVFKFAYGYDEAKAPADRDAYKKYLLEAGIMKVAFDRQSGAAWYLEGADPAGRAMFRIVVNYGGKHLVCGGSLYKDSGLGDIRDAVLIQAKSICESIQL